MYKVFAGSNSICEVDVHRPKGKDYFKVNYKYNGSKFIGTTENLSSYNIFETLSEAADYLIELVSKRLQQKVTEVEQQKELLLDIVTKYKINGEV